MSCAALLALCLTAASEDALRKPFARGDYARVLSLAGDEAPASDVYASRALRATGRYREAVERMDKSARKWRTDARVRCELGEAFAEVGEYDRAVRALVLACEMDPGALRPRAKLIPLLRERGKLEEADELVGWFFEYYNEQLFDESSPAPEALMWVAVSVKDEDSDGAKKAYSFLKKAAKADPLLIEAWYEAGVLALEKFHWAYARDNFGKVLASNPNHALAHVGMAFVIEADPKPEEMSRDAAGEEIRIALRTNPDLIEAHNFRARQLIAEDEFPEALKELEKSLATNPLHVETLSLLAACRYQLHGESGKGFREVFEKVVSLNPKATELYGAIAQLCEQKRQMTDAIKWYRKSIELDEEFWPGHYGAGVNLVRAGEEREGYRYLDRAFELNPFNLWARNILTALDKDFRGKEFVYSETEHFFTKLSKLDNDFLRPYVHELLEESHAELTRAFDIRLKGPRETGGKVLFEMFAEHDDFSARTAGLPNLGALGACLGQVVTMPSPRTRRFNWRKVLKHEFAHVVTLQKSRYRIPRWFTEGISVWYEKDPQLQSEAILKWAADKGKLVPLEELNRPFRRPKYRAQVQLVYYEAGVFVELVVEKWGKEVLVEMCEAYARGARDEEVFQSCLGASTGELSRILDEELRARAARVKLLPFLDQSDVSSLQERLRKNPGDAEALSLLALAASSSPAARGRAADHAKRALEADAGRHLAHLVLGRLRFGRSAAEGIRSLRRAAELAPGSYVCQLELGCALAKARRYAEAVGPLEKAVRIYPHGVGRENLARKNPKHLLVEGYLKLGRKEDALAAAEAACEADPLDYESAMHRSRLALEAGDARAALDAADRALSIAPFEAEPHGLAGEAALKLGDSARAKLEYSLASRIESTEARWLRGLVRACLKSNDADGARDAAAKLFAVDPTDRVATRVLEER